MHRIRVFALLVVASGAAFAQLTWLSSQVVSFVRSSAKTSPDKQVAEYLRKVTLSDRLTDDAIERCIQSGAGPLTQKALIELAAKSTSLPETKKPSVDNVEVKPVAVGPRPPSEEQKRQVLEKVTEYARGYVKNLPNFTCTQTTSRYRDPTNKGSYRLYDKIVESLSYSDGHEDYVVKRVNDTLSNKNHWELGGTTSAGEFGTDMRVLFDPSSQTEFEWEKWTTWHGRLTHRIAYRVSQQNSSWEIQFEKTQKIISGYKGYVYVDKENNMIMRITRDSEGIPRDFPVQDVKQETNYEFTSIGESKQEFLVPVKSLITSLSGGKMVKNETAFVNYRKFGTESTITYETDEPPKKEK